MFATISVDALLHALAAPLAGAIVVEERREEMIQAWKTRDARVGSIATATPAPAPRLSPLLLLLLAASALKVAPVLLVLSRSSSYYSTPFYHYY